MVMENHRSISSLMIISLDFRHEFSHAINKLEKTGKGGGEAGRQGEGWEEEMRGSEGGMEGHHVMISRLLYNT